jgi:hypothetical protein
MAQWRWRRRFRGLVASLLRIAALHTGPSTPRMHRFFFLRTTVPIHVLLVEYLTGGDQDS